MEENKKVSENKAFYVNDIQCDKARTDGLVWHNSMIFIFVIEGKIDLTIENRQVSLVKGQIIYIPSATFYSLHYYKKTRIIFLSISSIWMNKIVPEYFEYEIEVNSTKIKTTYQQDIYDQLIKKLLLLKDCFYSNEPFSDLGLQGYMFLFIQELLGNFSSKKMVSNEVPYQYQKQMKQISEYVYHHISENITLDNLAKELDVTPQYISKLFKKRYKKNFKVYLDDLRISRAVFEMEFTNHNLLDISIDCGFPSQHAFINSFKRVYGMTPSEYRRKIK